MGYPVDKINIRPGDIHFAILFFLQMIPDTAINLANGDAMYATSKIFNIWQKD